MIFLAQLVVFLAALAGIAGCSLAMIYFAGRATNRARARDFRVRQGVLAVACLCGIVASAGLGFVGVGAIMYWAGQ
jgi:cbb3-type cytochrome oxidase subunit 3